MNLIGTTIIVITTNAIDSEIWPRLAETEGNTFIWSVSDAKQFSRVSRLVSAPQKKIRYVSTYTERSKLSIFHMPIFPQKGTFNPEILTTHYAHYV